MADAGAIKAGLAYVSLGADLGPLQAGLDRAASMLKGYATKIAVVGASAAALGASITAPLGKLLKDAVGQATDVGALALQLGLTAEKASALQYAFGGGEDAAAQLTTMARKFNTEMANAADGNKEAIQSYERLGLSWEALAKMSFDQRIIAVGDAIGKVANDFDRTTQAINFFGRGGIETLKLIGAGGDVLRRKMAEAGSIGATVTDQQVKDAKAIKLAWGQMSNAVKFAFLEVGRALLPNSATIKEHARVIMAVAGGVRGWIRDNAELIRLIFRIGVGLGAVGAALIGFSTIMVTSGLLMAKAFTLAAAAGAAFLAVVKGGFILLAAIAAPSVWGPLVALGALGYLFATRTESGRRFSSEMGGAFRSVGAEAREAWGVISAAFNDAMGGILSALRRGDLKAAGGIALAGLRVIWAQAMLSLGRMWDDLTAPTIDAFHRIRARMGEMWDDLREAYRPWFAEMGNAWSGLVGFVRGRFSDLRDVVSGVVGWFEGLPQGIKDAAAALLGFFTPAIAAVAASFREVFGALTPYLNELGEGLADNWGSIFSRLATMMKTIFFDAIAAIFAKMSQLAFRLGATRGAQAAGLSGQLGELGAGLSGMGGVAANASARASQEQRNLEEQRRLQRQEAEGNREFERLWRDIMGEASAAEAQRDLAQRVAAERERESMRRGRGEYDAWEQMMRDRFGRAEGPDIAGMAREVRGTVGATLMGSTAYQQAFGVGSQNTQRDLLRETERQTTILEAIQEELRNLVPEVG